MIDEELYQQAADELNSDRRRPHIWARACALASDDHDEARYLYTNLRVEELLAEREAGLGETVTTGSESEDHDATLALELVDPDLEADGSSAPIGLDTDSFSLDEYTGEDEIRPAADPADDELNLSSPATLHDPLDDSIDDGLELLPTGLSEENEAAPTPGERQIEAEQTEVYIPRASSVSAPGQAEFTQEPDEIPLSQMERDYHEKFSDKSFEEEARRIEEILNSTLDESSDLDGTAVMDFEAEDLAEFQASLAAEDDDIPDDVDLFDDLPLSSTASNGTDESHAQSSAEGALNQNNAQLDELLDGIFDDSQALHTSPESEAILTADFSDASGTQAILVDDELDWLDSSAADADAEDKQSLEPYAPATDTLSDTDKLAQELERQADDMPGQTSDIIPHPVLDADIHEAQEAKSTDSTEADDSLSDKVAASAAGAAAGAAAGVAAAAFTADNADASTIIRDNREFPMDLSEGDRGTLFNVYRRDSQVQAVKDGVSWSALFLTLPYLIYRHLFGTALVYTVMSLIILVGLLVSGLSWLDAGSSASTAIKACTGGFALLALVGLLYIPFRYANDWRSEKLEDRGFELVAWVTARNPGKAIIKARRASALD